MEIKYPFVQFRCNVIYNTLKWQIFISLICSGPASVLAFLRAHLRKAEPFRLLKMLVIGPARQGKTTLLEILRTGRASPFQLTEHSISTSTWELDKPNGGKNNVRKTQTATTCIFFTFSAWPHTHTHTHTHTDTHRPTLHGLYYLNPNRWRVFFFNQRKVNFWTEIKI